MSITGKDISAVYDLAALAGDDREMAAMREHFDKMFRHLEDLSRISVEGVEPYFLLPHRELPQESDRAALSETATAIRRTFAQESEGFLVVPRVVNRGAEAECEEE